MGALDAAMDAKLAAAEKAKVEKAAADAKAASIASRAADADPYTTLKVGTTGKTQAQLDAAAGAATTAKMINDLYSPMGITSKVDPNTGKVITNTSALKDPNVIPPKGPTGAPGSAWIWDGTKWIKPSMPDDGKTYTWDDNKGWVASDLNTSKTTTNQVDSIAAITALLSSYGLGNLGPSITAAVMKGYSADTINLIMQDPNSNDPLAVAFQTRFPANKARLAAGKSVLSAAEYLAAERTYSQVFQSYGMANLSTRDTMNSFLINDVSAAEVSDRVSLAVNRVQNADADTKAALATYYPMLNQADIVSAMLNPKDALPTLQRKVQTAEIGGAARSQGLTAGLSVAEQLASQGVTQAEARKGYATIADILPGAEKLSNLYGATQDVYGQTQGEQEVFGQLASAERKRKALIATETGTFGASSGNARGAFSTGYLSKQSPAGQF